LVHKIKLPIVLKTNWVLGDSWVLKGKFRNNAVEEVKKLEIYGGARRYDYIGWNSPQLSSCKLEAGSNDISNPGSTAEGCLGSGG